VYGPYGQSGTPVIGVLVEDVVGEVIAMSVTAASSSSVSGRRREIRCGSRT
jgi:hypothetical protein